MSSILKPHFHKRSFVTNQSVTGNIKTECLCFQNLRLPLSLSFDLIYHLNPINLMSPGHCQLFSFSLSLLLFLLHIVIILIMVIGHHGHHHLNLRVSKWPKNISPNFEIYLSKYHLNGNPFALSVSKEGASGIFSVHSCAFRLLESGRLKVLPQKILKIFWLPVIKYIIAGARFTIGV